MQRDPRYTFETFIDGPGTAIAVAYAREVAQMPGRDVNPFTLCGDSGTGKTHLMHAICEQMIVRQRAATVRMLGAERFQRECGAAIREGLSFQERFARLDCLLLDDLHFLCRSGQEELIKVVDFLLWNGKQVILGCDQDPAGLRNLDQQLRSLMTWGVCVQLGPCGADQRTDIAAEKAGRMSLHIPDDVLTFIADSFDNIRVIEGALNRLLATVRLTGRKLDRAFAQETLRDMLR